MIWLFYTKKTSTVAILAQAKQLGAFENLLGVVINDQNWYNRTAWASFRLSPGTDASDLSIAQFVKSWGSYGEQTCHYWHQFNV
jgi:hypothetical protein